MNSDIPYRPGHRSPLRWLDLRRIPGGIRWRLNQLQTRRARKSVEVLYRNTSQKAAPPGTPYVIADGMYDNPNHFFRMKLFLDALCGQTDMQRMGILRTSRETDAKGTLESLGFNTFLNLEETPHQLDTFRPQARALLAGVKSHADLLDLDLPEDIPAYVFYDTVLKVLRHPQPALDHPAWEYHLAELLRNMAIYADLFDRYDIRAVAFSHGWKNEYAAAVWTAIRRNVPAYHITAYYETLRIRRIADATDYACPKEGLSFADFCAMPEETREAFIAKGWTNLNDRATGATSDINGRSAYVSDSRPSDREAARQALGIPTEARVGLIYAHAWYDFPHIFGLGNFTDFRDWMTVTLEAIQQNRNVLWLLKPHPLESWYGTFRLADMATNMPDNIRILPEKTDSLTATRAADLGVTVHGTAGFEAAAHGIPVISADKSYYSDWPFVHQARSREHYLTLLSNAADLRAPTPEVRAAAAAFAYLSGAPHPSDMGMLTLRCDSTGTPLYQDIVEHLKANSAACDRETALISEWLASGTDSYSVYGKIKHQNNLQATADGKLKNGAPAEQHTGY